MREYKKLRTKPEQLSLFYNYVYDAARNDNQLGDGLAGKAIRMVFHYVFLNILLGHIPRYGKACADFPVDLQG